MKSRLLEPAFFNVQVNCRVGGKDYVATLSPKGSGEITVFIDQNVVSDYVTGGNGNMAMADPLKIMADVENPTVNIYYPSNIVHDVFTATFTFSEEVTGFEESDIKVTNGEVVSGTLKTQDNIEFTASIAPEVDNSVVEIVVEEGVVNDLTGSGNLSSVFRVRYQYSSISNLAIQNQLNVYPNPASSELNIELDDYDGHIQVEIHDLSGRVMMPNIELQNGSSLDVSDLPEGMYYLNMIINKQLVTRKL
ncbi:MAG: Ig-like domain-containing protein, partial [Bacteroidales bacterium]|nr:Ig-like domain-containing protein [Bacteroidales bacterium]